MREVPTRDGLTGGRTRDGSIPRNLIFSSDLCTSDLQHPPAHGQPGKEPDVFHESVPNEMFESPWDDLWSEITVGEKSGRAVDGWVYDLHETQK